MDFLKMFQELVLSKPRNAVASRNVENCSFGDNLYRSKNAYLCYFGTALEDCLYCENSHLSRDCVDCSYVQNSELCYECVDGSTLYGCTFVQDSHNCTNCHYSIDMLNCQDCFGCFGLRNQRFAIFNKVYSDEEYYTKLKGLFARRPFEILVKLLPEFQKHPRLSTRLLKGEENCVGDYIYWSKNAYRCFNVRNVQESAYLYDFEDTQAKTSDSYDADFGSGLQACYECLQCSGCNTCNFLVNCTSCSDCEFCFDCSGCRSCFGCVYLENKEYHILNQPFARDEYLATLRQIKNELKERKEYGFSLPLLSKRL